MTVTAEPLVIPAGRPARWPLVLLNVAAGILAVIMAGRVAVSVGRQSRLTHESGVWLALAIDASHGVVYRPLIGPLGYGGTRYFPLQFLIHGALIRCGLSPIAAGYVLLVGSLVALLAAMLAVLRRLGVKPAVAVPACVLVTGSAAAEMAVTMIRGDLFPAALNVAGLAVCVPLLVGDGRRATARRAAVGGAVFGLAFLAKETAVFGVAAVCLALWFAGGVKRRLAIVVAIATAAVSAVGLVGVQVASRENFLANLQACAGGGDVPYAVRHLAMALATVFVTHDPLGFAVLVAGIGAAALLPRVHGGLLPLLMATTAAVTLAVFLTPGIDKNHLLDLQVVCLMAAAVAISRDRSAAAMLVPALTAVALFGSGLAWIGLKADLPWRGQMYAKVARSAVGDRPGPLLTDLSLLPVLRGESPFVLDDFMLWTLCKSHPNVRADLYAKLDAGYFSAVVLKADPTHGYRALVWGDDFTRHLNARYAPAPPQLDLLVYQRRSGPASRPAGADPGRP